jgi:hypothetical protein
MNQNIVAYVLGTCVVIVKNHHEFRKGLIKQINDFVAQPESRTTDIIANIPIFLA